MFDNAKKYDQLTEHDKLLVLNFIQSQSGNKNQTADSLAGDLLKLPEYIRDIAQDKYAEYLLSCARFSV